MYINQCQHDVHYFSGGSLFLFDRKVLRYFRKDGHSWRKKKDGKTVKEAHERLKVSTKTDALAFVHVCVWVWIILSILLNANDPTLAFTA